LQVYKQRYGELKQQMDALSKQLETLKAIVPDDKKKWMNLYACTGGRRPRRT